MQRKILFVIDALARGGTELQLTGLIDRLDRDRWAPHLLTIRPTDPALVPADCVHWAWDVPRLIAPGAVDAARRLAGTLRTGGFQAVQTYFQDATVFGAVAARWAGTPVRLGGFRDMGFWRTRGQELLMRRAYPLLTGFVANAEIVKAEFAARDGLDPARIRVIYNGIDAGAVPWTEHPGPTRAVGLVGNLNRRVKRADVFIRAAGLVARRHPDLVWRIYGDGEFRGEYEELARAEGLAGRIEFAGNVPDVTARLADLQIGVLSSDSEGLSNALLEYMLAGCVPVATRVGGNPEVIDHEETGLLVPPDDPEALAAALAGLVEDDERRRRLAAAARRAVEERFGWARCVAAHEEAWGAAPPA